MRTTVPPPRVASPGGDRASGAVLGRLNPTAIVYLALAVVFVATWVIAGTQGYDYVDQGNLGNMLTRSSVLGIVAVGQTLAILTGSLDLSVAYVIGLTSLIAAETMAGQPGRIVPAVAAVLTVAAFIGLVNGLVITRLKVNPFIATLGMALILQGYLALRYAGPSGDVPTAFQHLGYARVWFVPVSTLLFLALAAAAFVVLRRTRLGHGLYAVGGDEEVARLSGVRTGRMIVSAHVLCSVCAGITGLVLAARLGAGSPYIGTDGGYDLESIAAVVLGGTLLAGGKGGVLGTVAGVLILAVLDSLFNVFGLDSFVEDVVRGVIIIAAVAVYAMRRRSR